MRIAAFAVLMLVLTACAPGAYVIEWNTPTERAPRERVTERVTERVVEVEVPVIVPVPRPPVIRVPRPPVPPIVHPPVAPPIANECSVKSMPERSPWLEKIKCPGEPARLVPRP